MTTTSEYRGVRARAPKVPEPSRRAALRRIPGEVWVVGVLTLIAAVLRFATIASQSYWADEGLTAYEIHLRFGPMLSAVSQLETTPPLYFIVAWVWYHVIGTSEAAVRSLSALAGIAVVPVGYLCGRELVSRRAGVIAAAFATFSPFLIWYSQEARAYMLLIALTGVSFLFFARAERDPSKSNLFWWVIFSALALGTHFFAGFLVAPEALWLLWRARTWAMLLAVGAVAAVQVALVPLAVGDTSHGVQWIHKMPLLTRIGQIPPGFAVANVYRHVSVTEGLWGGGIALVLALFLLLLGGGYAERRGALVAGAVAACVLIVPLVVGVIWPAYDFFLAKNLAPAWIPLFVVLAAACAAPRTRDWGTVAAAVLVTIFVVAEIQIQTNPVFQKADWKDVAHAIGASTQPRAILVEGGQAAIPLKVFLPGVSWVQPPAGQRVVVDQVAIVGTVTRVFLRGAGAHAGRAALPILDPSGGVVFVRRTWIHNFDVAQYQLPHPWRFTLDQLSARAGRFFHRVPKQLLILVQRPTPGAVAPAPTRVAPVGVPGRGVGATPYGVGATHHGVARAHHRGVARAHHQSGGRARHGVGAVRHRVAGRARHQRSGPAAALRRQARRRHRRTGRRVAAGATLIIKALPFGQCGTEGEPGVNLLAPNQCSYLRWPLPQHRP